MNNHRKSLLATRTVILLCVFLISSAAHSSKPPESLNEAMSRIGNIMVDIYPTIVARRALTNEETTNINHALSELSTLFHYSGPFIRKKPDTYGTSYELILEYLDETLRAMQAKNTRYGRSRLHAIGTICTSCHTQDTKLRTLFSGTSRKRFNDDFSYAEFNYVTRNYEEAIRYFEKYLLSGKKKTELEIIRPLQRIITIYAQIYNRPGDGAKKLREFTSLKQHTQETRKQLKSWIEGLDDLQKLGVERINPTSLPTLKRYVTKYLGPLNEPVIELNPTPQEEITLVWLRGQLYHYLNKNPARDEIPRILYWLAISDRGIGYNFYFSLADLYLKQCVKQFPSHPYAKFCYNEYREYINYAYSGSAGTFIPDEIEIELEDLKSTLK